MLEQELKLAQDLTANLRGKVADLDAQKAAADQRDKDIEQKRIDVKNALDGIHARELAIKDIESAQAVLAEVKAERSKLDDRRKDLEARENTYALNLKKLNDGLATLARDQQLIADGNELIKKERAQLKADRENMKQNIIKELQSKV